MRNRSWSKLDTHDSELVDAMARIKWLHDAGLTTHMVIVDFLRQCLALLQARARPAWFYCGDNNDTRLHIGAMYNFEPDMLKE